jgi:hypothetical protein
LATSFDEAVSLSIQLQWLIFEVLVDGSAKKNEFLRRTFFDGFEVFWKLFKGNEAWFLFSKRGALHMADCRRFC